MGLLSALDGRIQTQNKIIKNLETLMLGFKKKLFSQKLSFKDRDGKTFPDWQNKELNTISQEVKRTANNQVPNDFEVLTIVSGVGFVRQQERFNQVIAGQSLAKYTLLKKQEFSFNRGASKKFQFGCFYSLKTHEMALVPNIYISFVLNEKSNPEFFNQLFSTGFANSQLRQFISSSARLDGLLNINRGDFFSIKLPFPNLSEQAKIANFLCGIDEKLMSEKKALRLYEKQKQYLLQNLFI